MQGLRRSVDFGLAVWALRSAALAGGKITPLGALMLLPTAVALARDGAVLARDGARYLRNRRQRRRFILRVR